MGTNKQNEFLGTEQDALRQEEKEETKKSRSSIMRNGFKSFRGKQITYANRAL